MRPTLNHNHLSYHPHGFVQPPNITYATLGQDENICQSSQRPMNLCTVGFRCKSKLTHFYPLREINKAMCFRTYNSIRKKFILVSVRSLLVQCVVLCKSMSLIHGPGAKLSTPDVVQHQDVSQIYRMINLWSFPYNSCELPLIFSFYILSWWQLTLYVRRHVRLSSSLSERQRNIRLVI